MVRDIDRRTALFGAAGAGLAAAGGGLLASACSPQKSALLPVNVVSSQGIEVVTINQLIVDKGYFTQVGLKASTLQISSGTNIIGPLLNGQADICIFAGFSQLLAAIEKGAALKILGGASIKGQQFLFSKNPAIQHVKDLEGRTVGVGAIGAQLHQVVSALLRKKGVDLSKVRFVNVGSSGDVFKAVAAGTVDAGNGQADVLSRMDQFGVHIIQDGVYATELPEYTWQASFSSIATIAAKRETLIRTLEAYCKGYRYTEDPSSKDDFVKAQIEALKPRDVAAQTASATSQWTYVQQHKPYATDLVLSPERVQYMQELNVQSGSQKKILPYDQVVDLSLAQEAVKRLS